MTETTDELMDATYAALCKHGYASLRMKDIADESSKSKATLHYHFDSKQELLYEFLDFLYDRFERRIAALDGETAVDRLLDLIDIVLASEAGPSRREFRTALLEIKAQGPYDDRFRAQLERFDRLLFDRIRSLLETGQSAGIVRADVDPVESADFIVTVFNGAQTRHVGVGHPTDRTRKSLTEYVTRHLLDTDDPGGRPG